MDGRGTRREGRGREAARHAAWTALDTGAGRVVREATGTFGYGTAHDKVISKRLGKTVSAVTVKRVRLRIPALSGWAGGERAWTERDITLLGTADDEVIATRIGWSAGAVFQKRVALAIPVSRDRRKR